LRFARSEKGARALQPLNASPKLAQFSGSARKLMVTLLASPIVQSPRGSLPVLLSVPHSGRDYPEWLLENASGGRAALSTLEDPLVDRLVWRALNRGCGAVIARAPRAAVDCNRAEDDIDPSVIDGARRARITARARGGLGIVPSRTQQHGFLWRRPITPAQLEERLDQAHRPYHDALDYEIALLLDRFGCALLIDCHSMPPPQPGTPAIVFGDGRGRTADAWISRNALEIARRCGFEAGLNEPFAGGHVIERHACPARNVHALQLEVDRRCYLDETLREAGAGFDAVAAFIDALVLELGEELAGRQFATAAE
jgi:N-formylglutamate amidohydrolase